MEHSTSSAPTFTQRLIPLRVHAERDGTTIRPTVALMVDPSTTLADVLSKAVFFDDSSRLANATQANAFVS